jgi:hypothetical protein
MELEQKCNKRLWHIYHLASIIPLSPRCNGPLSRNDGFLLCRFYNFKATLDLLMGPSSKFISLGALCFIKDILMGGNCMNNMVMMHHCGLFVYLDFKYFKVIPCCQYPSDIHKSWHQYK